ncbi:MAG: tRNA (adenosine(37)-N6)-threonylcarbamoyltransferase complex ATPase subunit type 1 TsaE [candidate division WOR-3 bacterium]
MVFHTAEAAATVELGRSLGTLLAPGQVVAFYGELGSGKTTMIKGVALGLGVRETVKSPSFVIITEYQGRMPVYHIDLYRITGPQELDALGLDSYLAGSGVCLVEWAERAQNLLPPETIQVRLKVENQGRNIEITGLADAALKALQ